jgi:hypothetical protein
LMDACPSALLTLDDLISHLGRQDKECPHLRDQLCN